MHESSYRLCEKFSKSSWCKPGMSIAEVGSQNVNGSYRDLFPDNPYTGFDISAGKGVDVVIGDHENWGSVSSHKGKYDIVISGQVLEHVRRPWLWMKNIASLGKVGGTVWICAPNTWGFHEFPIDCWRVWPDGMSAVFEDAGIDPVECFFDGPDTVGIGTIGSPPPSSPTRDLVTYTCCFGNYDELAPAPGYNCYVIHDGLDNIPTGWKSIRVESHQSSPKMDSRFWKMNSHLAFPGKETLYIDANARLKVPPYHLANHMDLTRPDLCAFKHNKNNTIKDEIKDIIKSRCASPRQVSTGLTRANGHLPVAAGGCIYRKPTKSIERFNEAWWECFSKSNYGRDQVIFSIFLDQLGVKYHLLDEQTAFYGPSSPWMVLSDHLKPRSKT